MNHTHGLISCGEMNGPCPSSVANCLDVIYLLLFASKQLYETKDYIAHEIMFQVHLKAMTLDAEYEMAGKSLDD